MTLALIGALAVGLTLGLLGSGGSILTVPVLTFLVGQDEKVAIASSLVIVGGIAAVAALRAWREGKVDGRSVLWFGLPGMAGSFGGAALGGLVPGEVQLAAFAVLMLVAARSMVRSKPVEEPGSGGPRPVAKILLDGLVVGVITGFVGVGGGFLIVPALGLLGGLPMATAVGTSLVIIAMKAAAGFAKYVDVLDAAGLSLDWSVIGLFVAVGIAGSLVGRRVGGCLPEVRLRQSFAVLLLVMGSFILAQGAWKLSHADRQAATSAHAASSQVGTCAGAQGLESAS